MAISVDVADDGAVRVRSSDIGVFVQHFGSRLSSEGLLLETDASLPRGREIDLRLGLDEGLDLVEAVAMVAWKRRPTGGQPAAVGLHLLAVTSGAEFIQRLVDERAEAGRSIFDLETAAPVSEDGEPIAADQIDRMIASRGERSAASDLFVEDDGAESVAEEPEDTPDFAPGFGKSETWNQQLQAGMPQSVSNWLGGADRPGGAVRTPDTVDEEPTSDASGESDISSEAAGLSEQAGEGVGDSSRASGGASSENTTEPGAPSSSAAANRPSDPEAPGAAPAASGPQTGTEDWRSANPEVKPPPDEDSPTGPFADVDVGRTENGPATPKRSGPIKMKLAADRQPAETSASESLSGALASSFVEASRRAENLLKDDAPKVVESPSSGPTDAEALSTVVLRPDQMKQMVERARGRAEDEDSGGSVEGAVEGSVESSVESAEPSATSGASAASEEPAPPESAPDPEPSQLSIDPSVLQTEPDEPFGYPQEERSPMLIISVIVALIAVALVLWLVLG